MRNAIISILLFSGLAFGQAVTISPCAVTPGFAGLNDATCGGLFTSSPANHVYFVYISATGTPDKFKWDKDNGGFSSAINITGAAQALADGVTITFGATTGHTVGGLSAGWRIAVTANGSIATSGFANNGLGASPGVNAQTKLRQTLNLTDFVGADPTGVTSSSTALYNCITQAMLINGICDAGPGQFLLATEVVITIGAVTTPYVLNNFVVGLTGRGAAQQGSSAVTTGTLFMCGQNHAPSGDTGSGCLHIYSTSYTNPVYILRDFTMSWAGTSGESANAIMIDGNSVALGGGGTVLLSDVGAYGFNGTGTAGLWIGSVDGGPEDNNITNFFGSINGQCMHLSGAFNASILVNPTCNLSIGDQVYIEGSETITIYGGVIQSGQTNGLHLRGVSGLTVIGTHFENDNTGCATSTTGYQGQWNPNIAYATNDIVYYSPLSPPSIPSSGSSPTSLTYTAGNGFYKALMSTTGNAPPSSGSDWVLLTAGGGSDPTCRTKTADDGTPIGYGAIVWEAGAVSAGGGMYCDVWGNNCSTYPGGYNEHAVMTSDTLNALRDQVYAFSDGPPYNNSDIQFKSGQQNSPLAPTFTYDSSVLWMCNHSNAMNSCPQTTVESGPLIVQSLPGGVGNWNALTFQDPTGLYYSVVNHYWDTGPDQLIDIYGGCFNGSCAYPFGNNIYDNCVGLGDALTPCGTWSALVGTKGLNVLDIGSTGVFVNGTRAIGSGPFAYNFVGMESQGFQVINPVPVAMLGTCGAGNVLERGGVTDSTSETPGYSPLTGGGAFTIAVQCIYDSSSMTYLWIVD